MYIELFKYVEGDETCESGEYLGYVSLEEDDIYIDVDSDNLAEKIEDLFSSPLQMNEKSIKSDEKIEPYTEDFFRNIIFMLPEMSLRGRLKVDEETDAYVKRSPEEGEDIDEEEIEMEVPMGDMQDLDEEEYELDDEGLGSDEEEDEDY